LNSKEDQIELLVTIKNPKQLSITDTSLIELLSQELNGQLKISSGKVLVSF
jgi:hypothetical protein